MQQQGPILVPASIPLRRRRGSHSSESSSTMSDTDSRGNFNQPGPSTGHGNSGRSSGFGRDGRSSEFDDLLASEVSEWRSKVEQNRTASGLRHRTNISVHVMDQVCLLHFCEHVQQLMVDICAVDQLDPTSDHVTYTCHRRYLGPHNSVYDYNSQPFAFTPSSSIAFTIHEQ